MHYTDPAIWIVSVLSLLAFALVCNDAIAGCYSYRDFRAALAAAEPEERERVRAGFLLDWSWQPWVLTLSTVGFVALVPGVDLRSLGLAWPDFGGFLALVSGGGFGGGAAAGIALGIGVALIGGMIAGVVASRRKTAEGASRDGGRPAVVNEYVEPMLPTGPEDRRAWVLLSITAGVTEEIMYRGLLLLVLSLLMPDAPIVLSGAIAVVAFGIAHIYQGWAGVVSTTLLAVVFVGLYAATGSVLIGMIVHVAIDMRLAFVKR